jgi:hypothetical protein
MQISGTFHAVKNNVLNAGAAADEDEGKAVTAE